MLKFVEVSTRACFRGKVTRQVFLRRTKCLVPVCTEDSSRRSYSSNTDQTKLDRRLWLLATVLGAGGVAGVKVWLNASQMEKAKESVIGETYGEEQQGLPSYSADDVSKHYSPETRVWVSFKSGVYDITDFIGEHPGGEKILMGAGGSIEPFWELYAVHKSDQVLTMLEKYRIGNLVMSDRGVALTDMSDPYSNDPHRHPALKPSSKKPFNAEPPMALLVDSFLTPNAFFFVRNHLPVPEVDVSNYALEITGIAVKTVSFSLQDLKTKFPKHTIVSTIQCAGNRRSELNKVVSFVKYTGRTNGSVIILSAEAKPNGRGMPANCRRLGLYLPHSCRPFLNIQKSNTGSYRRMFYNRMEIAVSKDYCTCAVVKEVKGLDWGAAAISTAEWGGVLLLDVLNFMGADLNDPRIQHVHFEGLDTDPANVTYGASIPVDKAFNPKGDVLLAYEMNGEPIPKDHGYPVRVVVPGVVGARNVKWLGRIILSDEESDSHWQKRDYKGFSPNVDWKNVDFDSSPAIQELPVNSAICNPSPDEKVKAVEGKFPVKGYAWSGGGRKIVRVDVSADGGRSWNTAELQQEETPLNRTWSWTLWEAQIPVPSKGELEIICKAVDASYNVQPESFGPIWNLRGVLGNAWHRIKIKIE